MRGTRNTSNKWVTDTEGINLPALVSLLKTHDLKENNKYQHLKDELPADVTDMRPYLKHRSEDWKEARKNILNASKAGVLTWHFGLTQAQDYWKSAIQGESIDDNQGFINKLAMGRGTVCEDCARVTYYVAITWLWNRIMDNQASNIAIKICLGVHKMILLWYAWNKWKRYCWIQVSI